MRLISDSISLSNRRLGQALALIALAALLGGCASKTRAPVEDRSASRPAPSAAPAATAVAPGVPAQPAREPDWRPATYVVKRGDTLHQIALDHGIDYRELAAWNNIENVNLIRVGQALRLSAPGEPVAAAPAGSAGVTTAPLRSVAPVVEAKPAVPSPTQAAPAAARNTENYKSAPKALKEAYSEQAVRDVTRAASEPVVVASVAPAPPAVVTPEPKPEAARPAGADGDDDALDWMWPARGRIVGNFSETANLKGIDIAGTAGQPVLASAAGTVVYAGTGLRGYGKLIIIKHNKTYLSAYAHNRDILVKEGQAVTRGQKIAEMGNTDATEVKLHFEIRRLGKPMDPVRYLPPA